MKAIPRMNVSKEQQKALDMEVQRQLAVNVERLRLNVEGTILWSIYNCFEGVTKTKLTEFHAFYHQFMRRLADYYSMHREGDGEFICRKKLKDVLGMDVEELNGKMFDFRLKNMEVPKERWVSVGKEMPEDGKEVLVCTVTQKGVRNVDKGYRMGERFVHRGSAEVTHWMPLPPFPGEM